MVPASEAMSSYADSTPLKKAPWHLCEHGLSIHLFTFSFPPTLCGQRRFGGSVLPVTPAGYDKAFEAHF